MKQFTAYGLIGIGAIGYLFFKQYNGALLGPPWVWLLCSILITCIGFYLVYLLTKAKKAQVEKPVIALKQKLRSTGKKVPVTLENCTFIKGEHIEEVRDWVSSIDMYDAILDREEKPIVTEQIRIICTPHDVGNRFISQLFTLNEPTLKYHLISNHITLYVDRSDSNQYFFELADPVS